MAKKKRRKKSIGAALKYEVYGILLITISIIALSGEATVGRALSKLFGLLLGKFYFVLALVGVFVGLAVMVKRAWPKGWTQRRTGLLIFVLALTLSSSISEINARYEGLDREALSGKAILVTLDRSLKDQLIYTLPEHEVSIRDKSISGGYAGALQYSILFTLFGYYASLIVNFVMYAIALMLITGKSYVELLKTVKTHAATMFKLLRAKRDQLAARRKAAVTAAKTIPAHEDKIDDDEDEHLYVQPTAKKRKSLFFSWHNDEEKENKAAEVHADEWLHPNGADQDNLPSWQTEQDPAWEKTGDNYSPNAPSSSDENPPWADDELTPKQPEAPMPELSNHEQPEDQHGSEQRTSSVSEMADSNETANALGETKEASGGEEDDFPSYDKGGTAESSEALLSDEAGEAAQDAMSSVPENKSKPYQLPPYTLLHKPSGLGKGGNATDTYESRRKLEATLESFGVRAKVLDVVSGPAVTRYEVQPATGVKVSRIVGLTDDIALALAAKDIRMEAPIPGKSAIGIEVPNTEVSVVTMREVMETPAFQNSTAKLSIVFGRDIAGQSIVGNLARMPHLLVAGATGSGKSVCINGIITSILYKAKPDEVKFLMIDPKMVELNVYNGIPHLLAPVVTNPRRASLALKKIVVEMEKRYELFSKSSTRNIEGYNTLMADNPAALLPYIVVIVDELADLMMVAANDVEDAIARLAQMARAAGIHLIIATQRPSVDVITGVIKANIPSRIAFGVSSQVDSRTILDMAGAEKLLGRGDMLFLPVGMSKPIRVQGAFLSDQEVESLVSFVRDQGEEAEYKEDLVPEIDEESTEEEIMQDELFDQAATIVVEAKQASVSLLQRRLRVGYTRAARLIDQLEAKSIIGPYEGSKPREVLMTAEQYQASRVSS
ncbi:DNA translocase FtsK [Paenibacillus sp. J5C_2022]|uniref:DNA translocase FtsK n=1 Tax=Paenibacillus sp. J5C2022 TaxID=2977129 RepID=UPI0021D27297|nr:DNA translocase FtsK [Paenibacillus sp. J5C2022]MCU6707164.1 DNA translocase FtsK [Paenibacillus sp. J5C2022]